MLYFPCIADASGRIRKKVSEKSMSREAAENFLKRNYYRLWRNCEAIPQPE